MIHISQLTKMFDGVAAVDDVSFRVAEGETVILLGTSGCGKTTTLNMINRLLEPTSGTIEVNGRDIRSVKPEELRRGIGYVIQHIGLFPHYTIAENIATVPHLLNHDKNVIQRRTTALLEQLHLPPETFLHKYPHELSGGQRQRVGLARALAADPPIVLMDEPFGALDPITRAGIRREFRELEELKRKTIVMVTHDVAEAFELGDRICLMDAGRVQQLGTAKELLLAPANTFVRAFFAENRTQLMLGALTLADIADALPESGRDIDSPIRTLALWEAMERAAQEPGVFPVTAEDILRGLREKAPLTAT